MQEPEPSIFLSANNPYNDVMLALQVAQIVPPPRPRAGNRHAASLATLRTEASEGAGLVLADGGSFRGITTKPARLPAGFILFRE